MDCEPKRGEPVTINIWDTAIEIARKVMEDPDRYPAYVKKLAESNKRLMKALLNVEQHAYNARMIEITRYLDESTGRDTED